MWTFLTMLNVNRYKGGPEKLLFTQKVLLLLIVFFVNHPV